MNNHKCGCKQGDEIDFNALPQAFSDPVILEEFSLHDARLVGRRELTYGAIEIAYFFSLEPLYLWEKKVSTPVLETRALCIQNLE